MQTADTQRQWALIAEIDALTLSGANEPRRLQANAELTALTARVEAEKAAGRAERAFEVVRLTDREIGEYGFFYAIRNSQTREVVGMSHSRTVAERDADRRHQEAVVVERMLICTDMNHPRIQTDAGVTFCPTCNPILLAAAIERAVVRWCQTCGTELADDYQYLDCRGCLSCSPHFVNLDGA